MMALAFDALQRSQDNTADKYWKLESLDNTLSTVESDGSFSSDDDSISEVPLIVETSPRERKNVAFVLEEDDEDRVYCHFQEIEPIDNPSLWWNEEECHEILEHCSQVVHYYKRQTRMCAYVSNLVNTLLESRSHPFRAIVSFLEEQHPQVLGRGLEQHIVGSIKHHVQRHRQAVLETQEQFIGTAFEFTPAMWEEISKAAEATSGDCKDLALRVAQLDELAALDDYEEEAEFYY